MLGLLSALKLMRMVRIIDYSSRQNRFELGAKTRCVWVSVKYTVSHGLPHVACK